MRLYNSHHLEPKTLIEHNGIERLGMLTHAEILYIQEFLTLMRKRLLREKVLRESLSWTTTKVKSSQDTINHKDFLSIVAEHVKVKQIPADLKEFAIVPTSSSQYG